MNTKSNSRNNNSHSEKNSVMSNKVKGGGRGFAAMDPEEQRKIASKGGKAAHEQGVAHEWDSSEARVAGQKGGQS